MAKSSHYNGDSFYANTDTIDFYLDIWNDDINLSTTGDTAIEIVDLHGIGAYSCGNKDKYNIK